MKIITHVPATTANLGPGFDCLGLALDIWNTITVEPAPESKVVWRQASPSRRVDPRPLDFAALPGPRENLVLQAMEACFARARCRVPSLRVTITQCIPISRGLGSSAAAIVGGLVAANAWSGERMSQDDLLALATEMEGHPDNVSAALLGGLTISAAEGARVVARRLTPPRGWRAVLFIPEQGLSTHLARSVLPRRVARADAIFNVGRTALLVHAFAQADPTALDLATRDKLHQPYRAPLVPGMEAMLDAARQAGASGGALSGAGPTLIALTEDSTQAERVRRAWSRSAHALKVRGSTCVVALSARGAYTLRRA